MSHKSVYFKIKKPVGELSLNLMKPGLNSYLKSLLSLNTTILSTTVFLVMIQSSGPLR
jgi:hypothetical protein